MTVCERIVARMTELRINQKQLSIMLDVAPSTLHTWLFRNNDFPASYAAPFAAALQTSTDWLLTGIDPTVAEIPADCIKLSESERAVVETMRAIGYEGSIVIQHAAVEELRRFRIEQGRSEPEPQTA